MSELELEGNTLGEKHQHYNRLVQDAISSHRTVNVEDFNVEDSDVINLLNIDVACHNKQLNYILKVLTCNDMMYVSRVIKQSNWLINDPEYSHIINPEYLRTKLFPQMYTKAIIKLNKYIRNNLQDQKRVEEFFSYEENPKDAVKWLPRCSLQFIYEVMTTHADHIELTLLKRLCERSITVLEIYIKNITAYKKRQALQANIFLLSSDTEKFLDIIEDTECPEFNKKATTILMKRNPNRIIEKFDTYFNFIHLPTFIKYLKQKNIKDFLLNQAQNIEKSKYRTPFRLKRLILFIGLIPQEIRYQLVEEIFINKGQESKEKIVFSEKEKKNLSMLFNITAFPNNYIWYQFAPFNVALQKIHELIGSTSYIKERIALLRIILMSAQNNLSHERTFLEYLRDNQKYIEKNVREQILTNLILKNNFIKYDMNTWNVLDDIFKSTNIYIASAKSEHVLIEAIILYNVINKQDVSEIVKNKFHFNSLVAYHKALSKKQKEILFIYLYDLIMAKLKECKTTNEKEFEEKVDILKLVLNLLKDYRKELENYPTIICIVKDIVKAKNDSSWALSIEALFNIKKTWRKLFFEESLTFCQTESAILNALKHGPSLLEQNETVIRTMLCNDRLPLKQVLGKIKIYWTSNLAKNITLIYTEKLNGSEDHKATTRGLSVLLPYKNLREIIEKYTPKEAKIDWSKINEIELSIQKQFAKTMHMSRPQPSPETILQFARGDYLQHAMPSLLSIFYNLNSLSSQTYILNLLNSPVSLQKHGIRLAVSKLKLEELLSIFSNIWKNNKNATIRSVMFKTVHTLLCKEKDPKRIKTTWQLLEMFIDNITFQEDKAIYKLLFEVENLPLEIQGLFYTKSYNFIHKLLYSGDEHEDFEYKFYTTFTAYSKEIIEQLQPSFVAQIISEYITKEFTKKQSEVWSRGCVMAVISSYLLSTPDEQTQLEKYETVFLPILKESFSLWNSKDYIRKNLVTLLNILYCDIKKYVIDMNKVNPNKMFLRIQEELNNALGTPANYMLLTKWKLIVTFTSILDSHKPIVDWEKTCLQVANEFGHKCRDYLKEDCDKHFPRVYLLFATILNNMISDLIPTIAYLDIYKSLIHDTNFIQSYLAAILLISKSNLLEGEVESNLKELLENISKHPSPEIKLHYYNQLKNEIF